MAGQYAKGTEVPACRSRGEIERTLRKFGAKSLAYGWDEDSRMAMLMFTMAGRQVRFVILMPDPAGREFTMTPTGRKRTPSAAETEYETAVREKWRALLLIVKAKLVAVASGIVTFEDEFMAHLLLPSGMTVGDTIRGGIADAYATGEVKPLLPDYRRAIEAGR